MRNYKCAECGGIFKENRLDTRAELIDHFAGYGNYYEYYYVCPECNCDYLIETEEEPYDE